MEKLRAIEDYIKEVFERGGTDLHLAPKSPPGIRIGGKMRALGDHLLTSEETNYLIFSLLDEQQRKRLSEDWELDFLLESNVGRLRGNAHYTRNGLELALRLLPSDVPRLEVLGHRKEVVDLCQIRQGLILVAGVAGSGKTTTLASMVRTISKIRSGVIVTIEDPIEYHIGHAAALVKQREIGSSTKTCEVVPQNGARGLLNK